MNKIVKNSCLFVFLISITLYILVLFFVPFNSSTGKQELEFMIILAFPCFMLLFYSFNYANMESKKKFLILYLIAYIVALFGFVLSSYRFNYATFGRIIIRDINLIPFSSIKEMLNSGYELSFGLYNIIGNFLMLFPIVIILPLLNKKYDKWYLLIILLLLLSLSIETIQYFTNSGSFDIDDILLNTIGAIMVYFFSKIQIINNILNNIFLKYHSKKKIYKILFGIFLIASLISITIYTLNIIHYRRQYKVDFSELKCQTDEKTYVTSKDNYRYYTKCDYGNSYIYIGGFPRSVSQFINSNSYNEKYGKYLNVETEKIITYVEVIESNDSFKKLVYENKKENNEIYLVNIDDIYIYADDNKFNLLELLKNENTDIKPLAMAEIIRYNQKTNVSYGKSNYFNIIICHNDLVTKNYIVPLKYELSESLCF